MPRILLLPKHMNMQNINNKNKPETSSNVVSDSSLAYKRMKSIATGLFIIMTAIYVISKFVEIKFHWVSYIRAFSEAAMVGALADWFAVTALFRHPMGIPIPHTAIIPNSKDRIGEGLGSFISRNFLQPEQVKKRLEPIDLAQYFANWVLEPNRARQIANGIASTIPRIMALLKDGPIYNWLESTITDKLRNLDVASLLADAIGILTSNNRHRPIVDLIIFHADLAINNYEPEFREKVSNNTNWLPKLFSVDDTAADSLLASIRETLREAAHDPNHKLRNAIDDAIKHFQQNLRSDPNLRDNLKNWIIDFSEHPVVTNYIKGIWADLKRDMSLPDAVRHENIVNALENSLSDVANSLLKDNELRLSINARFKQWAVELSAAQGENVGKMVADTIKSWDATTTVNQIENAVGRDLQYIRINGTVIGGIVGLFIHIISQIIFKHLG